MTGELLAIITATVGIVTVLSKVVDKLVDKLVVKRNGNGKTGQSCFTLDDRDAIKNIRDLMSKTDEDGAPLIYVPRSNTDILRELDKSFHNISLLQEKMIFILEKLAAKLDK